MDPTWKAALAHEFRQPYFKELAAFIEQERREHTVYPPEGEVFRAFDLTYIGQPRIDWQIPPQ